MEYTKRRRSVASILPNQNLNAAKAASEIYKAIDGLGTDEDTVIKIVSNCTCEQRQLIQNEYLKQYQKDLVKDLKSEIKIRVAVDFKQLLTGLFYTAVEFDSICLKAATKGLGTDEKCLVEILLTRSSEHLAQVKDDYQKRFHTLLEDDIAGDTSGDFRKLAYTLSRAVRKPNSEVDREKAREYAKEIHVSYSTLKGTDEPRFDFIGMCSTESFAMINAVFGAYGNISGQNIYQFIDDEFSGDTADGLKAIAKYAQSPADFFAEKLFKSVDGIGTDDGTLIRIITSRAEVDLNLIRERFLAKYDQTLESAIKHDTSGGYKRLLIALVNGNYEEQEKIHNLY